MRSLSKKGEYKIIRGDRGFGKTEVESGALGTGFYLDSSYGRLFVVIVGDLSLWKVWD